MNFSNIFFDSFQMVDRHLNHLSRGMQNSQAVAVAVFAVANSALFSLTMCLDVLIGGDWFERRNFQRILAHGMVTGLTFAVFNILLARLIKYPLNAYILTAIMTSAMVVRMLTIVIKHEITQSEIKRKIEQEQEHFTTIKAEIDAEWEAKAEAAEKARVEAEKKAKAEAEKAKAEAEKAKAEAAEKARIEAEQKAKAEAAEKARIEAEQKAKAEAAEKARIEAEQKAKAEAAEKARIEAEKKTADNC